MRKKMIRQAINYPYNLFLRRFNNSKKIDFTDFLVEIGYIDNKEELIKRFDENKDANKKINDLFAKS